MSIYETFVQQMRALEQGALGLHLATRGADPAATTTMWWCWTMTELAQALADILSQSRGRFGIDALHEACTNVFLLCEKQNLGDLAARITALPHTLLERVISEQESSTDETVCKICSAMKAMRANQFDAAHSFALEALRSRVLCMEGYMYNS